MNPITSLCQKKSKLSIGLMSGTCTDGIDAALVHITGSSLSTKITLLSFLTVPYPTEIRQKLLQIANNEEITVSELCKMNFLLGELSLEACIAVCKKAEVHPSKIDFVASHGHTVYHQPLTETFFHKQICSTLQIGEASIICEKMHCPVISDFRVRDMAAGGLGAPLVPYSEYLLYSQPGKNIALLNIGGIGNLTFLPADAKKEHILAFDTGPGNMIIDAIISSFTDQTFDEEGNIAALGKVNEKLLSLMIEDDPFPSTKPPKTTGREAYGASYVKRLLTKAKLLQVSFPDLVATVTMYTAKSVAENVFHQLPALPDFLILGGGGSKNKTLIKDLKLCLSPIVILTNEELGYNSKAKEAIAFAILGNETLCYHTNNIITATGARHEVVMGKISL